MPDSITGSQPFSDHFIPVLRCTYSTEISTSVIQLDNRYIQATLTLPSLYLDLLQLLEFKGVDNTSKGRLVYQFSSQICGQIPKHHKAL
ncbi:uncharacterized protein METZ01_LOCUS448284 [marine metagenome]|uniref:Uncharacterized protein n=1 Tax=marine metagenome TaxID=408172 RepID=A0A382ZJH4_9ZZZZ